MSTRAIPALPPSCQVLNLRYSLRFNHDATDNGRIDGNPTPWYVQAGKMGTSAEGVFRALQMIDKGCVLLNRSGKSSLLSGISSMASKGWDVMAFPRLWPVSMESIEAMREITDPVPPPSDLAGAPEQRPTPTQISRRIDHAMCRTTDALATYNYAAGTVAESIAKAVSSAATFRFLGDFFSLFSDSIDGKMAAMDWNRSRLAVADLRNEGQAPADVVHLFVQTQRLSLIKLVKCVFAVTLGIFSVGAVVLSTALVSNYMLAALAFGAAMTALLSIAYRQSMQYRPVDMFAYYRAHP